jgi:MarR family transcriptional regulator, transcriptional regulator for hemolysin
MESTTLSYLLQHTSLIMHRQTDQILQERLGIGMAQLKILTTVQERPHVQQRYVADSLGQTEASISRQVRLLEEKGLVVAQINPQSKREHVIVLTAKGSKFTQAARDIIDQYHSPAFEQLSDKERQQLTGILQHLHMHCCQDGKPYACGIPWFSPQSS